MQTRLKYSTVIIMVHTLWDHDLADAKVFFNAIMYCVQIEKPLENHGPSIKAMEKLIMQVQDRIHE
jgi:hypothetical protein